MQKLGSLVGKRISKVYRAERKDGAGTQVTFVFLDFSRCTLTSPDSEIEIDVLDTDDDYSAFSWAELEGFETIEHAEFDKDRAYRKRVRHLLITLWDKAGTKDYVKSEWNKLEEVLSEAGCL